MPCAAYIVVKFIRSKLATSGFNGEQLDADAEWARAPSSAGVSFGTTKELPAGEEPIVRLAVCAGYLTSVSALTFTLTCIYVCTYNYDYIRTLQHN